MGLAGVIILFILMAVNAAADGDYSGFELIGKILLFIALFLVIGSILATPALLVAIVVVIILIGIISVLTN